MNNVAPVTSTPSVAGFPDGVPGVTPPTDPAGTGGFLSDVIVALGFADSETVERAVEAARQPGRMVDRILLESGDLTEEQLSRALAERHGLDHVDLDRFPVDMSAASLISRTTALRYRAIPIVFATDGALIVAVADPVDALAISDLEVMTRAETRRAVASGAAIDAVAEQLPEVGTPQLSPPSSNTEPQSEPTPEGESAPATTDEAMIDKLEAATEQSAVLAGSGAEAPQQLEEPSQPAPGPDGGADRSAASEARLAALEAELAKAHDLMREQAEQAEAEGNRLQEQTIEAGRERDRLSEALDQATPERDQLRTALDEVTEERDRLREALDQVTPERDQLREALDQVTEERDGLRATLDQVTEERDHLREALDQVTKERDDLSTEAQRMAGEFTSVQERATRAESLAEEASARVRELEDADRRAETARLALKGLREESEREREQGSRLERKLREDLAAAQERSTSLERRLEGLMSAASEAQEMAEELISVSRAITGEDLRDRSDDPPELPPDEDLSESGDDPPAPAAEPAPTEANNGSTDNGGGPGPAIRKPTI